MIEKKVKGFYTDEQKRIRPLTEYFKEYGEQEKLEERKSQIVEKIEKIPPLDERPKSVKQAAILLKENKLMVVEDPEFQILFDKINREHFKGQIPSTKIVLARLPNVRNYAFFIAFNDGRRYIVINVAGAKTRDVQEKVLKHEMIHAAGLIGHDFRFKIWCEVLDAPFEVSEDGRLLSVKEYEQQKIEREIQLEKEREKRRIEFFKWYKEKHPEEFVKPHARVIGWTTREGKFTVPRNNITREEQIPKNAKDIMVVTFDELGRPKREPTIVPTREELLQKYKLVA